MKQKHMDVNEQIDEMNSLIEQIDEMTGIENMIKCMIFY
jgi:hypothetical protein